MTACQTRPCHRVDITHDRPGPDGVDRGIRRRLLSGRVWGGTSRGCWGWGCWGVGGVLGLELRDLTIIPNACQAFLEKFCIFFDNIFLAPQLTQHSSPKPKALSAAASHAEPSWRPSGFGNP